MSKKWWMSLICALSLPLVAVGCGDDGEDTEEEEEDHPEVDCATATIPSFSEVTAFTNSCNNCHASSLSGGDRQGAPPDINFDTYDSAKANAEDAVHEVYEGAMPLGGYTITEEEKQALYAWGLCGTPE